MSTLTDNQSNSDPFAIVEGMADLLAKHKLVPFFGVGISRQHLWLAAAELAHEMANEIGCSPETPLADVADAYTRARGQSALWTF